MKRSDLYNGHFTILFSIIVYIGFSFDIFGLSKMTHIKELFHDTAIFLVVTLALNSIGLLLLFLNDQYIGENYSILTRIINYVFMIQIFLITIYTFWMIFELINRTKT